MVHRWNSALEQQAFSRVYRVGQLQETKIFEMIVKGTIEERMTKTKMSKDEEINGVVQSTTTSTLSFQDLAAVFTSGGEI